MKIYTRKEEFFKRYNLNGTAVPVTGKGYRMDYYTDDCGRVYQAFLENQDGRWFATEFHTGFRINTYGFKTRKECAAFVEKNGEKISCYALDFIKEHKMVALLGPAMTEEEYYRAVRAGMATEEPTEEAAETTEEAAETTEEPQEEPNEPQEVETAEPDHERFIKAFESCETLEDLKRVYSEEYSEACYSVNSLANLRRAYEHKFEEVKCMHRTRGGKVYSTESAENHETVGFFPEFVEAISNMTDVYFNIEGTWMWVSGDTKPHREELKKFGLRWAPKRKMWYKKPAEKCPAAV